MEVLVNHVETQLKRQELKIVRTLYSPGTVMQVMRKKNKRFVFAVAFRSGYKQCRLIDLADGARIAPPPKPRKRTVQWAACVVSETRCWNAEASGRHSSSPVGAPTPRC